MSVSQYIKQQPKEDQAKLIARFKEKRTTFAFPDKAWWSNLIRLDPENRAEVFWKKYSTLPSDKQAEYRKISKQIPGILSTRFLIKLRSLNKEK